MAALPNKASNALAALPEPSVSAVLAENDLEALLIAVARDRKFAMEAQLRSQQEDLQEAQKRAAQLLSAFSQNGQDDQKWKTYCAQHPELLCVSSDTPNFGAVMAQRVQEMLYAMQSTSQMDMLRIQTLNSRRNEAMDMISNLLRKMADARLTVITNMR